MFHSVRPEVSLTEFIVNLYFLTKIKSTYFISGKSIFDNVQKRHYKNMLFCSQYFDLRIIIKLVVLTVQLSLTV